MQIGTNDIINMLVTGTLIILLFSAFMILVVRLYNKRGQMHFLEKKAMQEEFQKNLAQSKLEIQEEILNEVSREIHDNVGQMLSLAKIQLNIINHSDPSENEMLNEVKISVSAAMTDLRDIAKSMNSDRAKQLSLPDIVDQEVRRIEKTKIIKTEFQVNGEVRPVKDPVKLIVYRVIQESIQNILKHSGASMLSVVINYDLYALAVIVEDNGCGFDITNGTNSGLGLQNIRSRIKMIGGLVSIDSKIGSGTIISLNIPYESN